MNNINNKVKISDQRLALTNESNSLYRAMEDRKIKIPITQIDETVKLFTSMDKILVDISSLKSTSDTPPIEQKFKKIERKELRKQFYATAIQIEISIQTLGAKIDKRNSFDITKINEFDTKKTKIDSKINDLKSAIEKDKEQKLSQINAIKSKLSESHSKLVTFTDSFEGESTIFINGEDVITINKRDDFKLETNNIFSLLAELAGVELEINKNKYCSAAQAKRINEIENGIDLSFSKAITLVLEDHTNRINSLRAEILNGNNPAGSSLIDQLEKENNQLIALYHEHLGEIPRASLEEIPLSPLWAHTDWGSLIGPDSGIDALIFSRISLLNRDHLDENGQKELHAINRLLYHAFLNKIITIIHEKNHLLKNKRETLSQEQIDILESSVEDLNQKYESFLECYKKVPIQDKSFVDALLSKLASTAKWMLSLGYLNDQIFPVEEIERRKKFADLGFDMKTEFLKLFKDLQCRENETYGDVIKREIQGFLTWADQNPHEAQLIAGDVALTVSILQDEHFINQFHAKMRAIAYMNAFQQGWNGTTSTSQYTPEKATLKYYALSQITRYAPKIAGIVTDVVSTEQIGVVSLATSIFTGIWKGSAVQAASSIVPPKYANLAFQAVNVIKGDLPKFLEEQKKVELVRLAGITAAFVSSPKGFFHRIRREATIWWKTVRAASGREKVARIALQIILPILSFGAFGLLAQPLIVTAALAPSVAITLFSSSIKLANMMEDWFDATYGTRSRVIEEMKQQELEIQKTARREHVEKEITQIHQARDDFIRKLRSSRILPDEPIRRTELFNDVTETTYQNFQDVIVNSIKDEMNQEFNDHTAAGYVQRLIKLGTNTIKQKIAIETITLPEESPLHNEQIQDQMANEIAERLIQEWLAPRLDRVFVEKVVELSFEETSNSNHEAPKLDSFIDSSISKLKEDLKGIELTQDQLKSELHRFFGPLEVVA